MNAETFKIGEIYGLKVQGIVRQNGINFFTLRYKGKNTKPRWAKRGLTYHTPILPEQDNTDTEQFIGKTIQCRVAYFIDDFPVFEQVDESKQTPCDSLLPIFNHNATAQSSKKTALRGVSSNRRQTKEPVISPKPAVKPSLPLPNEEERILVGVISSNTTEETKQKRDDKKETTEAGKKVPESPKKSDRITALETRADNGDTDAQFELGQHYENKGSIKQANQWYQKAAGLGHMDAKFRLGVLYLQKAIKLFQDAAEQNHEQALEKLDMLTKPGAIPIPDSVLQHIWMHDADEDERFCISRINRQPHKTGVSYPAGTSYQSQDFSSYEMSEEKEAQVEDKEEDTDLFRVWMNRHSSVEGGEGIGIADGATGNHSSDDDTNIWPDEEEVVCAETESSGHEKVESEQHDIEFSDTPPAPVAGCICCRFIQRIKNLFSQLTRH